MHAEVLFSHLTLLVGYHITFLPLLPCYFVTLSPLPLCYLGYRDLLLHAITLLPSLLLALLLC